MAPSHAVISWALSFFAAQSVLNEVDPTSCDTVQQGYTCEPSISEYWGIYSPYYTVPTDILADLPEGCQYTFASILSRHGARYPTDKKSSDYKAMIKHVKSNVKSFKGKYAFLSDYEYTLGHDNLTDFGRQQLVNSGIKFFERYSSLASNHSPFVRSSGEYRVVDSAIHWVQGFESAKADPSALNEPRYDAAAATYETCKDGILVIPEGNTTNNTLCHGVCKDFISQNMFYSHIAEHAQKHFEATFVKPITKRLNQDMPGANLDAGETIDFMDLCPFMTVASPTGAISPFCALFSEQEWHSYNYYQTLGKFYGYGPGNPLGPTQGVGYAAELLARLTGDSSYVTNKQSYTSINHTLDADSCTFPPNRSLYADFSHDNDVTSAMAALGLFDFLGSKNLSLNHLVEPTVNGYSAGWTVPFAGRVYFEKMTCDHVDGELVRIVNNDRVMPLEGCDVDDLGRCKLDAFVASRKFALTGGEWDQLCFS